MYKKGGGREILGNLKNLWENSMEILFVDSIVYVIIMIEVFDLFNIELSND